MTQNIEREFGWDDTIEKDGGGGFTLLPAGDYFFTVAKFERSRFAGSEKMPACNQAKLELTIHSPEHGDVTVFHNLFLHTKTEGLLSNFFSAIGQKRKGEPLRMNWQTVTGSKGKAKLGVRNYRSQGEDRSANEVKTFYSYEEAFPGGQVPSQSYQQPPAQPYQQQQPPAQTYQPQQGYQQPPQQGYQQQQHQPPFPPAQGQGGWQQGKF
ncbi:hypothetical protein B1748_29015 [Paenibacillus sp. MY03]|uniref:hypothetical protein n=1 Tax=Paenibacillus sp. MY03 TaxID=302980 RepID=UPI000B3C07E3|nr:hypothetical protein [Paenibacillus sp. MY03]OUS70279.1 hypothetical protein B1748_29015 [Paenibacillus sp. MY03]